MRGGIHINYNDFIEMTVATLPEFMPDNFHGTIEPNHVEKLQGESYYGIAIKPDDNNIGISMDLNDAYAHWNDGTPFRSIISELADTVTERLQSAPVQAAEELLDYDQMRSKLFIQVIPTESNAEMLSQVPHKNIEDMSMVYRFMLENGEDGMASVLITDSALSTYGITAQQLHEDAMVNAPISFPVKVQSMEEMLAGMLGVSVDALPDHANNGLYVATCNGGILGAGCITYPDFMENAAQQLDGDFFILPSSIHEVILLPDRDALSIRELEDMVQSINEDEVAPADRLSNNVYHYDAKEHVFEKAENFQARMQSKEKAQTPMKESVLKKLKEKTPEIKVQDAVSRSKNRDLVL